MSYRSTRGTGWTMKATLLMRVLGTQGAVYVDGKVNASPQAEQPEGPMPRRRRRRRRRRPVSLAVTHDPGPVHPPPSLQAAEKKKKAEEELREKRKRRRSLTMP